MYQPKKYKKETPEVSFEFIQKHPFATMVLSGEQLLATHLPILIEGTPQNFRLYGHIANHNEMRPWLTDGTEALLIFQGANGYVSSSWYQEKNISTWDYSAVHVKVKLEIQTREALEKSLENLVHRFEKEQESPLFYRAIPLQMLKDHLPLITGFWARPMNIKAIAKLHQGTKTEDIKSVVEQLRKQGNNELSNAIIRENKLKL